SYIFDCEVFIIVIVLITKVSFKNDFLLYFVSLFKVGGIVAPSKIALFQATLFSNSIGFSPLKIPCSKSSIITLRSSNIQVVASKVILNLQYPLICINFFHSYQYHTSIIISFFC